LRKSRRYAAIVGGVVTASATLGILGGVWNAWHAPEAVAEGSPRAASPQEALREGITQFRMGNYAKAKAWFEAAKKQEQQLSEPERTLLSKYTDLAAVAAARQAEAERRLERAREAAKKGAVGVVEQEASAVLINPYASTAQKTSARALLAQIAANGAGSGGSASAVVQVAAEEPAPAQARTPTVPTAPSSAGNVYVAGSKTEAAQKLMADAVEALRIGDYDRAEELALKASSYGVKFSKDQVTPQDILAAVNRARRMKAVNPMATGVASTTPKATPKPKVAELAQGDEPAQRAEPTVVGESTVQPAAAATTETIDQSVAASAEVVQATVAQPVATETGSTQSDERVDINDLPPRERKEIARELLKNARELIDHGVLDEAEKILKQVEEIDVRWGWFEDSPTKVRRELRRARVRQMFEQQRLEAIAQESVRESTVAADGSPVQPAGVEERDAKTEEAKADLARDLLKKARKALEEGKLDEAERLALEAQAHDVEYGLFEDTPERVLRDVARARAAQATPIAPPEEVVQPEKVINGEIDPEVAKIPTERPQGSEREIRKIALKLLADARRRLQRGDIANAEEIARRVKGWRVRFGLFHFGDTPDKVLRACEVVKQRLAARHRVELKKKAQQLLREARDLIDQGKIDEAEAKVLEAKSLDVAYGLLEVTPDDLLAEIKAIRTATPSGAIAQQTPHPTEEPTEETTSSAASTPQLPVTPSGAVATDEPAVQPAVAEEPATPQEKDHHSPVSDVAEFGQEPSEISEIADIQPAPASAGEATAAQAEPGRARVVHRGVTSDADGTSAGADQLANARALYEQGNYERAKEIAIQVAQNHPELADEARDLVTQIEMTELNAVLEVYNAAIAAVKKGDYRHALELFRQVAASDVPLDPVTEQQLQEYVSRLPVLIRQQELADVAAGGPRQAEAIRQEGVPRELADQYERERIRLQQLIVLTNNRVAAARQKLASDPDAAIADLQQTLDELQSSGLDESMVMPLVRRVEAAIRLAQREKERIAVERLQEQARRAAAEQRARELAAEAQRQKEVQQLIEQGQQLFNEGRYDEAVLMAERARELDPQNVAAHALYWKAKLSRRLAEAKQIKELSEEGFVNAMNSVDWSAIPFDDREPIVYPDARTWQELTERRKARYSRVDEAFRSPMELEIERKLDDPIAPFDFQQTPLSDVIDFLRDATGINIVVDWPGLEMAGITTNTPVSLRLEGVRFRSALNLLVRQLGLTYTIRDDVLLITTPLRDQGRLITRVYDVADLVVNLRHVPKVVTPMGVFDANNMAGFGGLLGTTPQPFGLPNQPVTQLGVGGGSYDAQSAFAGGAPAGEEAAASPAGAVDFQSLIELITQTIAPESWQDAGGAGTIQQFPGNLSLVISQTQEVHDQIRDLLQQLRRLQDLQVVVEVRFITLTEDFLERIGVDFDVEIDDDSQRPLQPFGRDTDEDGIADILRDFDHLQSLTVGLAGPDGLFNGDLDIPFRTDGFEIGRPANFQNPALSVGVAFLSDIEVFLFLEAVQQDNRSNVLLAPKVTLFNGQAALVISGISRPFIFALVPVVAAGAVAFQPFPSMVLEGNFLFVQAVISADRRYVRLSVSPSFQNIVGERRFPIIATAQQIGFGGGQTQQLIQAELVLPIIGVNAVLTTVAVPDGGTVLLGGLKSKTEERREFGTPILNKLPYINRLFSNTGVGTVTQSLLMMVTPRIVILEEEEELRGLLVTP